MQPCLSDGPIALDGCGRDSKGLRRLVDVETCKEFQLDHAAEALVERMQLGERLVQRKEIEGADLRRRNRLVQRDQCRRPASLPSRFPARMIDQNLTHQSCGHAEEMGTILRRRVSASHQSQIGLVHEGGRLQRVTRLFLAQTCAGHPPQFVVHEWEQPLQSLRIPCLPPLQETCDVVIRLSR